MEQTKAIALSQWIWVIKVTEISNACVVQPSKTKLYYSRNRKQSVIHCWNPNCLPQSPIHYPSYSSKHNCTIKAMTTPHLKICSTLLLFLMTFATANSNAILHICIVYVMYVCVPKGTVIAHAGICCNYTMLVKCFLYIDGSSTVHI